MDADAKLQPVLGRDGLMERFQFAADGHGRSRRPLGVVRLRIERRVKEGHDRIAIILVDQAFIGVDGRGRRRQVVV